jgi:hypothetical protein
LRKDVSKSRFGRPVLRGGVLLLALSLASPLAAAAGAAEIRTTLSQDGNGRMTVRPMSANPGEIWQWEACSVDLSSCAPFSGGPEPFPPPFPYSTSISNTVGAPPETIFRAISNTGEVGLSPVWHGVVASAGDPSISGVLRANERVTPNPGLWSGGWADDYDQTQLAVCVTPQGTGCIPITATHYPGQCANGSAVIDPAFTGRYLRVAVRRLGKSTAFLRYASGPFTERGGIWQPAPTVAAAVIGRIGRATGRRTPSKCGPPPITGGSIARNGTATVACGLGCRAVLTAIRGRLWARRVGHVPRGRNPLPERRVLLRLRRRDLRRLGPGPTHFVLTIAGLRYAERVVHLP